MELTKDQRERVEWIKAQMDCPNGFPCYESGFQVLPRVKRMGTLLECLQDDAQSCPFALAFGYGYFCRCPLNKYVQGLTDI